MNDIVWCHYLYKIHFFPENDHFSTTQFSDKKHSGTIKKSTHTKACEMIN